MKQYEMFELSFNGPKPTGSEATVDLKATFTTGGSSQTVDGFYAGDGVYKIRFYPTLTGRYDWKVSGVINANGSEDCATNDDKNAGIVRARGTHFVTDGGAYFYPFGTTIYALTHQSEELIDTTMQTLRTAPFNKVRHCVFPKHYDYNHNDPERFAFLRGEDGKFDVNKPDFAFWDAFEARIKELADMGIQSDLILFHPYDDEEHWGLSMLSQKDNLIYLDYLLRRLSAMPSIWWSLANEWDLCSAKSEDDWHEIEQFVADHDPYGHLISNHQCMLDYDYSRPNITHVSTQTKYIANTGNVFAQFHKPICFDEVCYEGNLTMGWGNLSGFEMTHRFWMAVCQGAYCTHGEVLLPEKYDKDNEVLWWAKGGKLKGESSKRIAFLRSIVEELPGPLEYMDEPRPADETDGFSQKIIETLTKMGMSYEDLPHDMTELGRLPQEAIKAIFDAVPIVRAMAMSSPEKKIVDKVFDTVAFGHVADEAFIAYFGHHCNGHYDWALPKDHTYTIEAIDIWEMTRNVVCTNASGTTTVPMPGKEGVALLAKIATVTGKNDKTFG